MSYGGQSYAQGFFTPEDMATEQGIRRRQAYAQALLQGDTPQGAYGGLASAGNKLLGAFLSKQADTKEADLSKSAQESYAKNIAAFLGGDNAPPATPPVSISNSVGSGPQMNAASIPGGDSSGMEGPSSAPIQANAPKIPPQMPQSSPDMGIEGPVSPPAPIQSPSGQGSMPQPMLMAQNQAPVSAPAAAPQMTQMQRLLATGDPRLIQQFAPQIFTHQMDINDRKVIPISDQEALALHLRPGGVYGREAATGNLTTIQASDMKSQGAIDQALQEKINEANKVPVTAAEMLAHRDRQAANATSANQPHFVPYGSSSYIQNGKVINLPVGAGGADGSSPFGKGSDTAPSLQGQLGISSDGYNHLIGNYAAIGKGRPMQMASHEADAIIARSGFDPSVVRPQVQGYSDNVKINTMKANALDTLGKEIVGSVNNYAPVIDSLTNNGNLRLGNVGYELVGSAVNDKNAQKAVLFLNQMRADLAGFNAVSGGKIGLHGQVSTDNADFATADQIIKNGLSSGGAAAIAEGILATKQKNTAIAKQQAEEAQRGIWVALGRGAQFDALHKTQGGGSGGGGNGGGNSGGGKGLPPPPPGFVVH